MSRTAKTLKWVVINGLFAAMLAAGFVYGNENAENVAIFIVWFSFVGSFLMVPQAVVDRLIEKRHTFSVPEWVDLLFDAGVTLLLAWHGQTLLAVIYLVHIILLAGVRARIEEGIAKLEDTVEA